MRVTQLPLSELPVTVHGARRPFAELTLAHPTHVWVEYHDTPAVPEVPPTWADPGLPGEPAAVEVLRVCTTEQTAFQADEMELEMDAGADITALFSREGLADLAAEILAGLDQESA